MSLLDIIIPPVCHGCGTYLVTGENRLCMNCISRLPRTFYHLRGEDSPMVERFAGIFPFERAASWLIYSHGDITARLVHDFKYHKFPRLARRLALLMAEELDMTGFFNGIDAIIPIPQHWSRRLQRGYNQTEYLARGIAEHTGLPVTDNLIAIRRHRSQTAMTLQQRRDNINGTFAVRHFERLNGLHLLIVDDVCTTGATIIEAATTLLNANPTLKISILTLASTI
ncbi:MAG: ComF family protein [Muribaculaceae bacterium]|nr:ComF family protein [Muribaculaceae bacterium]